MSNVYNGTQGLQSFVLGLKTTWSNCGILDQDHACQPCMGIRIQSQKCRGMIMVTGC